MFKLKENGTTFGREVIAGLTTFFAMAYIIAVNPGLLSRLHGMGRCIFGDELFPPLSAPLLWAWLQMFPMHRHLEWVSMHFLCLRFALLLGLPGSRHCPWYLSAV